MRGPLLAAVAIASLAACQVEGTGEPAPPPTGGTAAETAAVPSPPPAPSHANTAVAGGEAENSGCGADKLARWRNVLPTQTVRDEIAATVGRRPIRYIRPGDAVTMDFSPSRLNVELGADGRIKRFRCG